MPVELMMVDDNPQERKLAMIRLQRSEMAFVIAEAGSGEECLQLLSRGLTVDVILLDLNMPGIGGTETLRRIRQDYEP